MTNPTTMTAEAMREHEAREVLAGSPKAAILPPDYSPMQDAVITAMVAFRDAGCAAHLKAMREAAARACDECAKVALPSERVFAYEMATNLAAAIRALPIGGE